MRTVLVDSNVLLDVATDDPVWAEWSAQALEAAADQAPLAINALIYAEVSIGFERIDDVEEAPAPPHLLSDRRADLALIAITSIPPAPASGTGRR